MLNSLGIASDGYLKSTTKKLLVIAVAGYLNFGSPVPPTPPEPVNTMFVGGGRPHTQENYDYDETSEWQKKRRIKRDDDEILHILKIWAEING